jgi:endonuclease G, mitochondrial
MANNILHGYQADFLEKVVGFPELNRRQIDDLAPIQDNENAVAEYINYSLQLSASRGFPYFTASNIDGENFKKAPRKDNWRKDSRIDAIFQWGPELYRAARSDFDKGHMTKREDVQWGESVAIASKAADGTFYYSNAVPQYATLNQQIWRSLEDYILHAEAKEHGLRISVFTGPVLSSKDPWFVTEVNNQRLQIPVLFWKVIYYTMRNGDLRRVGFLMSQQSLLFENGIVEAEIKEKVSKEDIDYDRLFLEFEEAETYQVNIGTIERLSGLKLPPAKEPYTDERKTALILKEVDVKESLKESANTFQQLGFQIEGIQLV